MERTMGIDLDPRVAHNWSGADGVARLGRWARFAVADVDRFRAEWRAVRVDGIQVGEWRSTPFSVAFPPAAVFGVALDTVIGGRMQYRLGDQRFDAQPGSIHLIRVQTPVSVTAEVPIRVARVLLLHDEVPAWVRQAAAVPGGPLPPTSLTAGFVAFLERITVAMRESSGQPPAATGKAIAGLTTALLEEAFPAGASSSDLRQRILGFIERHLGDQDLGPRRIADEFDISLRWVHQVFNQEDESVARYIRERRADAVAAELRTERRLVRVGELASRFGFAGRDQLTRTFKQRYGMTVNAYLDAVADGGSPQPEAVAAR